MRYYAAEKNGLIKDESVGVHGGDIYGKEVALDFSVNVNPLAVPLPSELQEAAEKSLRNAHRYPDFWCRKLRRSIAELEGISEERIVCGNGASELFMAIVRAVSPKQAVVLAPSFSGYEWALHACRNCDIKRYVLREESGFVVDEGLLSFLTDDIDLLFLAQPNNPTGRLVDETLLFEVLSRCQKLQIIPVIDSCFFALSRGSRFPQWKRNAMEICPQTIFVNAFTKTCAMPGIRLGYAFCEEKEVVTAMRRALPEWNVSLLAQDVGEAAARLLIKTDFLPRSVAMICEERKRLAEAFYAMNIRFYHSDTNFLLLKPGEGLAKTLLKEGILIRDCGSFAGLSTEYARIAVKLPAENDRLITAIRNSLSEIRISEDF